MEQTILEISAQIRDIMVRSGKTASTAESCTSGQIAALLTSVSGSSDYFQGGLTAYQNSVKTRFLGVNPQDIRKYDVVSRQVAEQMVRGACRMFGTDYALSSTGYAEGGNGTIPAGTIWIAWGSEDDVHSLCTTTDNGRNENTRNASESALRAFLDYIRQIYF